MICLKNIAKFIGAAFIGWVYCIAALADNGSSHDKQAMGGLVLLQREDITMVSQEVYISAAAIEVNYIFLNRTKQDITTAVTFPLPTRQASYLSDASLAESGDLIEESDSAGQIETWVGSEKINPVFQAEAVSAYGGGYGKRAIRPGWSWLQTFPAGEQVFVRHRYKPRISSGAALPAVGLLGIADETYCPDAGFRASVYYMATHEKLNLAGYDDISYLLTNGKNWAGGVIRNFRLVVDKGSPDALVTFCGPNIKKISPTKFEMRATNFRPRRDIHVLILRDWASAKN